MPLLHDVAHLSHAELLTPEPDQSLWFFTEVLGLTQNGASGDSVYLRTWDDYEHHSLKLTAASTSGSAALISLPKSRVASERMKTRAPWLQGAIAFPCSVLMPRAGFRSPHCLPP